MKTMNKANMMELNLNEMNTVCGGVDWKEVLEDAGLICLGGPIGELYVLGKTGAGVHTLY